MVGIFVLVLVLKRELPCFTIGLGAGSGRDCQRTSLLFLVTILFCFCLRYFIVSNAFLPCIYGDVVNNINTVSDVQWPEHSYRNLT